MTNLKKKILFIYPVFSSFVKTDYEILASEFQIERYKYKHRKSVVSHIIQQIKLLLFLIRNFFSFGAVYIWFADYHSLLPILFAKVLKRKSFLVLGGYDVTYIPELNYGSFNNPVRALCARYSIKKATKCLAVAQNIKSEALSRVPGANIDVIYTGYSSDKFNCKEKQIRKGVISVLGAYSKKRLYIKGADLIAEAAILMPETPFTLIAVDKKLFEKEFGIITNINFVPKINQSELIKYYAEANVYVQLSMREGLPNSLCEAMLCGAVPVGTNIAGIVEAIGNCGFILKRRTAKDAVKEISKALKADLILRKCARSRVIENFSLDKRRMKLLKTIKENI